VGGASVHHPPSICEKVPSEWLTIQELDGALYSSPFSASDSILPSE
jgi:hypothetical protein